MSTRSLTAIIGENREHIISIYRHCDGYTSPGGQGHDIWRFFTKERIKEKGFCYEAGHDAAHLIAFLCSKDKHDFILYSAVEYYSSNIDDLIDKLIRQADSVGAEYLYVIYPDKTQKKYEPKISVICPYDGEVYFDGNFEDMGYKYKYDQPSLLEVDK